MTTYTEEEVSNILNGQASFGEVYDVFRATIDEPEEDDDIKELGEIKDLVVNGIVLKFHIFYILNNKINLIKNKEISIDYIGRWKLDEYHEEKYKRLSLMKKRIMECIEDRKLTKKR